MPDLKAGLGSVWLFTEKKYQKKHGSRYAVMSGKYSLREGFCSGAIHTESRF